MGHPRRFERASGTYAFHLTPDVSLRRSERTFRAKSGHPAQFKLLTGSGRCRRSRVSIFAANAWKRGRCSTKNGSPGRV